MDDQDWAYLWDRRHQVIFKVQMNRHYQRERQWLMEMAEGVVKASSLVAGSVAFGKISDPDLVQWLVAVIFTGTAFSLVFGWGNKARDAAQRAGQWVSLLREIESVGPRDFSEEQLNQWSAKANEIEVSEPPALKVLVRRAFAATEQMYKEKPA